MNGASFMQRELFRQSKLVSVNQFTTNIPMWLRVCDP